MRRLFVAMSCEPPAEECPVSASGSRVATAPANNTGVADQRRTGMLAIVTAAARNAVHRHDPAVSTRLATDQMADGLSREASGWPVTSETVSGTNSAAQTVQIPDAAVPSRRARYPSASSTPLGCGGARNAEKRKDPVASTAAISPTARTNGRPKVVTAPGLGSPVAISASASDSAPRPAAVAPASSATPNSTGHTAPLRTIGATSRPEDVMCPAYGVS